MIGIHVFVGQYGEYPIPSDVLAKAWELNGMKRSLFDKRTKGAKYLSWWGRSQDAQRETVEAIKKHLLADISTS